MAISLPLDPLAIEKGFIIENYEFPFIRFLPSIVCGFAGIGCFGTIYLVINGQIAIGESYYEGSRYIKGKSDIIFCALFSPVVILGALSIYYSNMRITNFSKLFLFAVIALYYPINGLFNYLKYKENKA
ncbi:MAG: hypothetical protein PHI97_29890 [Desulfobulbus sp.]|nr:hypothetical protein [Desulfobulbus sp.]